MKKAKYPDYIIITKGHSWYMHQIGFKYKVIQINKYGMYDVMNRVKEDQYYGSVFIDDCMDAKVYERQAKIKNLLNE